MNADAAAHVNARHALKLRVVRHKGAARTAAWLLGSAREWASVGQRHSGPVPRRAAGAGPGRAGRAGPNLQTPPLPSPAGWINPVCAGPDLGRAGWARPGGAGQGPGPWCAPLRIPGPEADSDALESSRRPHFMAKRPRRGACG